MGRNTNIRDARVETALSIIGGPITFRRHDNLEELHAALFETTVDEIRDGQWGGDATDGTEYEASWDEWKQMMDAQGVYGFAHEEKREIHFWYAEDAPVELLHVFFGHEVGHIASTSLKAALTGDVEVDEELTADSYGAVALIVHRVLDIELRKRSQSH